LGLLSRAKELEASAEYLHKSLSGWLDQLSAHREKLRVLTKLVERNIATAMKLGISILVA